MNLAEGQKLFWQMLERRADESELARVFAASQEVPLAERASVYADAYVWRQVEALSEDFPLTHAYVGHEIFHEAAQAFVYAHPSRHPSLSKRGNGFADFLRAWPAIEDASVRARVADLAVLEWARALTFDAPRAETVTMAALQQPGVELATMRMIPALSVLTFEHPVVALWRALNQDQAAPESAPERQHVIVWRSEDVVYHAAAADDEAAALRAALAGRNIAEICACFAEHENPGQRAGEVLSRWFAENMVAAILLP